MVRDPFHILCLPLYTLTSAKFFSGWVWMFMTERGFQNYMLQLPLMAFKTEKYPSSNAIFIRNSLATASKGNYEE